MSKSQETKSLTSKTDEVTDISLNPLIAVVEAVVFALLCVLVFWLYYRGLFDTTGSLGNAGVFAKGGGALFFFFVFLNWMGGCLGIIAVAPNLKTAIPSLALYLIISVLALWLLLWVASEKGEQRALSFAGMAALYTMASIMGSVGGILNAYSAQGKAKEQIKDDDMFKAEVKKRRPLEIASTIIWIGSMIGLFVSFSYLHSSLVS